MTSVRKRVHAAMAAMMCLSILAFERWGDASVIQLVYTVASYSYGPILGMFAFGILCRRRVRARWLGGYVFGYEMLIINAALTAAGLLALSYRQSRI